jgi:hypothetical protein
VVINIATIPSDFQPSTGNSNYFKVSPGKHKIRILAGAVTGYVWWEDTPEGGRKPGRIPLDGRPPVEYAETVKRFLAFPIWNYDSRKIQVWEVTQTSIQKELKALEADPDWANLIDFDLEINREGQDMKSTKYRVTPKPKTPPDKDIQAVSLLPDLNQLFKGGDPFNPEALSDEELDTLLQS